MRRRILSALICGVLALLFSSPAASHDDDASHDEEELRSLADGIIDTPYELDHAVGQINRKKVASLPGSHKNVRLVSKLTVSGAEPGIVSDVAAYGNYAYLGELGGDSFPGCGADNHGGVYVIDISDPRKPVEVGTVPAQPNTYVSEGVQVVPIDTPLFRGDVLVHNNEPCSFDGPSTGGISLWDVTDPRQPKALAEGVGDLTPPTDARAHWTHSAFLWDAGDRAFAMLVDDEERGLDVDILEITNPRAPVLIAETGLTLWPGAQDRQSAGTGSFVAASFHHDHVVKKIGDRWYGLVSYWDAGWVILDVTNPATPTFVEDTTYPDPDPLTGFSPAEGNAHQAEWNSSNEFFIGSDEDFTPRRLEFRVTTGSHAGKYEAREMGWTTPVASLRDRTLNGPTVYGGYGCAADREGVPDAATVKAQLAAAGRPLQTGEELSLVLQRGPLNDLNETASPCNFGEKTDTAALKGYDALFIANHHNGASGGGLGGGPDDPPCFWASQEIGYPIRGICLGHRAMHLMFKRLESYIEPYPIGDPGDVEPNIGDLGEDIAVTAPFDGWGYIHLMDANTLEEIDAHAMRESLDEKFESGYGVLSVHEVATDPTANVAYIAWYGGGFRVVRFSRADGLVETGHYVDPKGNNFWGVEAWRQPDTGKVFALASDRNVGLYIFEYTGPK